MRTTSHYDDKVPINLDAPYPDDFLKDFKARLDEVQGDYNEMMKQARGQSAAPEPRPTAAEPANQGLTVH
jgi:hypothetical protein